MRYLSSNRGLQNFLLFFSGLCWPVPTVFKMTQDLDTDFPSIIVLPTAMYLAPSPTLFSTSYMDYVTSQLLTFFLNKVV